MAKVAPAGPLAERALPYQEPGIVAILTLSSFLYLLNLINHVLDRWVYCGLLGQVFIGVAWGAPGAQWLDRVTQQVLTQLGYLGLLLLVYEGMISQKPAETQPVVVDLERFLAFQVASLLPFHH